jgi:hypothetical protein
MSGLKMSVEILGVMATCHIRFVDLCCAVPKKKTVNVTTLKSHLNCVLDLPHGTVLVTVVRTFITMVMI